MALNIKDVETDRMARELAAATGESITEAVARALEERLARVTGRRRRRRLADDVARIQARIALVPMADKRPPDDALGYDAFGLPG
jgi:antitoxin VapB